MDKKKFNEHLIGAIDNGLQLLGESVRQVVYHYVERDSQLTREKIPERLEVFHETLEGTFGSGAKVIEKLIVRGLYDRLGVSFEDHQDWTIVDYVNNARKASC